ncbi:unnamed protein product [Diamesa hyperborea]
MDDFFNGLFTCFGENRVNECEDRRSRKVYLSIGRKVINECPKVTISNTLLKEQNYDESDVFAGTLNSRDVAIRVIKKEFSSEAIKESELLSKLEHHENIIKFHFKLEDLDYIYIITEHYKTSLEDYVEKSEKDKEFGDEEICLQLTKAVDFLHKQNVLYLNLNPENIHIVGSRGVLKAKLTNFRFDSPSIDGFNAPEFNSKNEKYGFPTDIYMLGCLFYYIITNGLKLPNFMHKKQQSKIFDKLNKYQAKCKTSDVVLCFDITLQMLWFNKSDRALIKTVLEHPFFWTTEKLLTYIIDVAVRIEEKDKNFYKRLETNSKVVVGKDWSRGLNGIYLELSKGRVYNTSSVVDLVKVLRNQIAHTNSSKVAETMGSNKEDLLYYFLEMFPHLIPHLYRVMNA